MPTKCPVRLEPTRREPQPTDDDLMAGIEAGDVEPNLALLEQRYGKSVLGYVSAIVRDEHLAEDVAQEVFAKVFFKSHLYRPASNFRGWLFEIARNQAVTALRSRRHTPKPFGSLELGHQDRDDDGGFLDGVPDQRIGRELEERELMSAFDRAVAALPDRYAEVFQLCVQRGVPYRAAADALAIPTGTVAVRIMRARRRLFRDLRRHVGRLRRPPACLQ